MAAHVIGGGNVIKGTAAKFLVAAAGAISTVLTTYYGTARWLPAALAGMAALLVYLVPNAKQTPDSIVGDSVPPTPINTGSV